VPARLDGPWLGTQRLGGLTGDPLDAVWEAAALAGVAWLDTAPIYGETDGAMERRIGEFLSAHPEVSVATKAGLVRDGRSFRPDGRARTLGGSARASRDRLGRIDLLQLHVPDPRVELDTTLRAMARLLERGVVGAVGLCNCTVSQVEQARAVLPVSSVQVEVSPIAATAVRSGVVEVARELGIPVLAWRPLGGADRVARILAHPTVAGIATRGGTSPARVVLAWLASLGVEPIPGPSRPATVRDALGFRPVTLDDEDRRSMDAAFPIGSLRVPRAQRRPPPSEREVMIVMGSPGSGKSTYAERLRASGAVRLNRDARGGTVDGLLAPLGRALADGARTVVLDNTYATRAARNGVIETAWAHRVSVRCVWMTTPDGTCEVNSVLRILDLLGRLPEPDELDRSGGPAALLAPRVLHRYREQLEPPRLDEGFVAVDAVPWAPHEPDDRRRPTALLLDRSVLDTAPAALREARAGGRSLWCIGWTPGAAHGEEDRIRERARELDVVLDEVALCRHPAGPPRCWCRKPLPGLAVLLASRHGAPIANLQIVATSPADRTLAAKLGIEAVVVPSRGRDGP